MQGRSRRGSRQPTRICSRGAGTTKPLWQSDGVQHSDTTSAQNHPRKPLLGTPLLDIGRGNGDRIHECTGLGVRRRIEVCTVDQEAFQANDDRHDPNRDENRTPHLKLPRGQGNGPFQFSASTLRMLNPLSGNPQHRKKRYYRHFRSASPGLNKIQPTPSHQGCCPSNPQHQNHADVPHNLPILRSAAETDP